MEFNSVGGYSVIGGSLYSQSESNVATKLYVVPLLPFQLLG
jgi:hypothetical protein